MRQSGLGKAKMNEEKCVRG